jgi:hypothetical protein
LQPSAARATLLAMIRHEGKARTVRRWRRVVMTQADFGLFFLIVWMQFPVEPWWLMLGILVLGITAAICYGTWLFRRWRTIEEFPERLHQELPFVPPAPPFHVAAADADRLQQHLLQRGARVIAFDTSDTDPLLAIRLAADAPSFLSPSRDNLRHGRLLGAAQHSGLLVLLWRSADRFARRDFAGYAQMIADLAEARIAAQPRCQIELFLIGDPAVEARAAG